MNRCENCRFWSQMCARSVGSGPIEALCLAEGGEKKGRFVPSDGSCGGFKLNYLGSVDDPPNYGEHVREEYLSFEGPDALNATEALQ